MHRHRTQRLVAALTAAAALMAFTACQSVSPSADPSDHDKQSAQVPVPNGPVIVAASVNQWGSLAQEIGGDDVEVTSILSSTGVDAHDFEPKTADLATLSKADVVVANGAGYDSWAVKVLNEHTQLVSAAEMVGAMEGDNPHLWFSKDARAAMAKELTDVFSKERPRKAKAFQTRLAAWQQREQRLDELMEGFARHHSHDTYAATEAVAYYLMADLGFKDVTPAGYAQATASEGESAPADLQDFQHALDRHDVTVLIDNPQESSDTATLLTDTARQADVPVVQVSEQMPEQYSTLVDWINALVNHIIDAADPSYGCEKENKSDTSGTSGESGSSDTSDESGTDADTPEAGSDTSDTSQSDGSDKPVIGRICPAASDAGNRADTDSGTPTN